MEMVTDDQEALSLHGKNCWKGVVNLQDAQRRFRSQIFFWSSLWRTCWRKETALDSRDSNTVYSCFYL